VAGTTNSGNGARFAYVAKFIWGLGYTIVFIFLSLCVVIIFIFSILFLFAVFYFNCNFFSFILAYFCFYLCRNSQPWVAKLQRTSGAVLFNTRADINVESPPSPYSYSSGLAVDDDEGEVYLLCFFSLLFYFYFFLFYFFNIYFICY
jgi:hypothetical protein